MDNFDLKKYLAEGKLHEEVGSDGRLYGHEGNPKLKHSKIHNSSNIDIKPGDWIIVPFGDGQSEGWVTEVNNDSLEYYEEKKSHKKVGEMIESEMMIKIDFNKIRDIENTGKEKEGRSWNYIKYGNDDTKRYTKGNIYIVKIKNAWDTIHQDTSFLGKFSKAQHDKIKKYDKNINK